MRIALLSCFTALALGFSLSASAQTADNEATMERMNRLENDLQILQKQVARGETPAAAPAGDASAPLTNAAQLEVRFSAVEDQLRELRGRVEEAENGNRRLTERLDNFQKDIEFRLAEASKAAPAKEAEPKKEEKKEKEAEPEANESKKEAEKAKSTTKSEFKTPRDHYNYAFRLLNQTQYDAAAESFRLFVETYPKDQLVGNAYYWQGEAYYIRRDYVAAADLFRQGFETMPDGPKAADNLYKLALSLVALDRGKEGCVVLQQVASRFKKTATNVVSKAEEELKKNNCRKAG